VTRYLRGAGELLYTVSTISSSWTRLFFSILTQEDRATLQIRVLQYFDSLLCIISFSELNKTTALGAELGSWLRKNVAMHDVTRLPHVILELLPCHGIREVANKDPRSTV
jgi:hypothetical protein